MFSRSLISIDGVLEESDLFRLLKSFGVEVVTSSLKSFSFDSSGFSTYVTSNKYIVRYLREEFALSYSTVEGNVTESRSLGSSKTYICVLDTNSSLDLLQKLAQYFDTSIETYVSGVSNRFIRNLLPS
jgi:hypothetical protein